MATPTIPNGEEHFFPIIYEGNGAGQRVGKFVPFTDNGTIANSCIFNDDDSPKLYRQLTSGNRKTWTISLWFKLGKAPSTDASGFWVSSPTDDGAIGGNPSPYNMIFFQFSSGQLEIQDYQNPSYVIRLKTNRTFEDTSKFYHLVLAVDTTQSTEANRVRMYIDGDEITSFATSTYPSLNADTNANRSGYYNVVNIGYNAYWDGYMAEFNFVDGTQLTPSTFGLTDTSTGRWIPKALTGITYGTNGFRLQFGSSSALGDDTSGNENDFSVTNLASTDQTTDSPTQNHATMNPNNKASTNASLSEGNLTVTLSNTYGGACAGMALPSSGKYYWEIKSVGTIDANTIVGIVPDNGVTIAGSQQFPGGSSNPGSFGFGPAQTPDAQTVRNSVFENCPTLSKTTAAGTYIQMCWDGDTGSLWFGLDNTFEGNPSAGTGASFTGINNTLKLFPACFAYADVFEFNFGQRSFQHTPPTGFVALQQDNLPETEKGVSGFVWMKNRDASDSHQLYDSSRGIQKMLKTNDVTQQTTVTDGLQKFLKGGQQIEDDVSINTSGESYVSWNWVANGGTTATNNDGSVTSTVQANTTAGFSIVRWTGGGSAGTVGHGLSQTPEWIFYKRTNATGDGWVNYHKNQNSSPASGSMQLQSTGAFGADSTLWNNTAPTSSVISIGTYGMQSSEERTAWVWHPVEGYSKFRSYEGNASADGTFVYTGFKPAFLIIKDIDNTRNWIMIDSTRDPFNPTDKGLAPSNTNAENTGNAIDFVSNGFKFRSSSTSFNTSSTYIYIAFAEHPFVGDGTSPVTAR